MCTYSCLWPVSSSRLPRLWRLDSFHLRPSSARGRAKRTMLHRSLCPARQTVAPPVDSAPLPRRVQGQRLRKSRPWSEVKSRRGAPKRVNTQGFACSNRKCLYFGITDAHIHAAFWGWQAWPGRAHPDVSRPCLPYHVHFQAPHCVVLFENPFSPDRSGALGAGRRTGSLSC